MPLEFVDLNSSPVVAVNCDNRKAMVKQKWHRTRFEKSKTKTLQHRVQKEKNDKMEIRFKSINSQNVSSYCGKNWKVITIYLIIVTVIIELIVKMIVMLMNKDDNK